MDNNLEIYQEGRPWGFFRRFTDNAISTVKIISVEPNQELSLQSHSKRKEFWRVIKGDGFFEINEEKIAVNVDDERVVPIGIKHRIKAGTTGIEVLEISIGDYDEKDIIRYEDKYGRV